MRIVAEDEEFCFAHAPENSEQRKAIAAKGGRAKGVSGEVRELKGKLHDLIDKAIAGDVEPKIATAVSQLGGVLCRLYEVERRNIELEEIHRRLDEMDNQTYQARGQHGSW